LIFCFTSFGRVKHRHQFPAKIPPMSKLLVQLAQVSKIIASVSPLLGFHASFLQHFFARWQDTGSRNAEFSTSPASTSRRVMGSLINFRFQGKRGKRGKSTFIKVAKPSPKKNTTPQRKPIAETRNASRGIGSPPMRGPYHKPGRASLCQSAFIGKAEL
jgi:hypothetical protein